MDADISSSFLARLSLALSSPTFVSSLRLSVSEVALGAACSHNTPETVNAARCHYIAYRPNYGARQHIIDVIMLAAGGNLSKENQFRFFLSNLNFRIRRSKVEIFYDLTWKMILF
jgi:hypothetical protein